MRLALCNDRFIEIQGEWKINTDSISNRTAFVSGSEDHGLRFKYLAGIFGGLAFIKWGAANGYTQYIKDFSAITDDLKTGMVESENREIMGCNTVSPISLDPLCWHLALMLIPTVLGISVCTWFGDRTGVYLPEYAIGFLIALIMSFILKPTGISKYIDYRITDRIAGTCTDFIVFFGVAKIKISVIITSQPENP